jgi:hypothetical protein
MTSTSSSSSTSTSASAVNEHLDISTSTKTLARAPRNRLRVLARQLALPKVSFFIVTGVQLIIWASTGTCTSSSLSIVWLQHPAGSVLRQDFILMLQSFLIRAACPHPCLPSFPPQSAFKFRLHSWEVPGASYFPSSGIFSVAPLPKISLLPRLIALILHSEKVPDSDSLLDMWSLPLKQLL